MGMVCLARNLRRSGGEVDLVMRDGACTVFVEVKLRANDRFGLGREAVTIRKQRRMGLVAAQYLAEKGLTQAPARFDVVEIQAGQLRHIPNAFSL
jgi:putative endonuclease